MTAKLIDGKKIAEKIISEIKDKVITNQSEGVAPPGLAVIQVGEDPASSVYAVSYTHLTLPTIYSV